MTREEAAEIILRGRACRRGGSSKEGGSEKTETARWSQEAERPIELPDIRT